MNDKMYALAKEILDPVVDYTKSMGRATMPAGALAYSMQIWKFEQRWAEIEELRKHGITRHDLRFLEDLGVVETEHMDNQYKAKARPNHVIRACLRYIK